MKIFKKVISIVLVILILISVIVPYKQDYNVYANDAAISLETLKYMSAFLLVAGGLVYNSTAEFTADVNALADRLYQSALLESEQWTGQAPTKTKGFEWKLYINENYKEEPNPGDPKRPQKYYIPIHVAIYEIAKAWIIAKLNQMFNEDPQSLTGLQPVSSLNSSVNLPDYNYSTGESVIAFYSPNGKLVSSIFTFDTYPVTVIKNYGNINVSHGDFGPNQYDYYVTDLNPIWYGDKYFTMFDGPSSIIDAGPFARYYDYDNYEWVNNPWFNAEEVAYWKIEDYDVLNTQIANGNIVELQPYGQSESTYDPTYDWSAADGIMYIPLEPWFDYPSEIPDLYPDGLPAPAYGLPSPSQYDLGDLQDIDVQPLVDGEPYKWNPELEEWRANNPDPGGDPDPDPDLDPFPFPEPGELPDPDTDLTPDPEPGGTVGEFILSIPILGDIYRVLLAIYRGVLFIGNWLSDFEFPTITIPPITFPQFPAIPTVAEIVAAIKEMILSVFIPDENYLATKFEPVIETFETKFGYDLGFLYSVQSAAARRPQNIEIDYMGSHGTIVSFDDLDDTLLIIRPWIQSLIYFMLMIYHVNNIYKMIRGTSLIELKMNEIQIHNTMNEGGFR